MEPGNSWLLTTEEWHLNIFPSSQWHSQPDLPWITQDHCRDLRCLESMNKWLFPFNCFFTVTYYLPELKTILLTKCSWISINGNSWFGESNNSLHSLDASTSYLWCSCTWNLFNLTTLVMALLTFFTGSVVLTTTF